MESHLDRCLSCGAPIDSAAGTVTGRNSITDEELLERIKEHAPLAKSD